MNLIKKITIILFLFSTGNVQQSHACDVCGCGAGSNFVGLSTEYQGKIIGLRYRLNHLTTELSPNGGSSYMTSYEVYQNFDIYASMMWKDKWNFGLTIPYIMMSKSNKENTNFREQNGIGDAFINVSRRILENKTTIGSRRLMQQAWIGMGIKLPTGAYKPNIQSTNGLNLFQLGSGSWDALMTGMYDIRLQDIGLNNNVQFKYNTANRDGYTYGNRLTTTHQLYYKWRLNPHTLFTPNAGIQYEQAGYDNHKGMVHDRTGGKILLGVLGTEFNYKNVAVGTSVQLPLYQRIAHGTAENQSRFMLHVSWIW